MSSNTSKRPLPISPLPPQQSAVDHQPDRSSPVNASPIGLQQSESPFSYTSTAMMASFSEPSPFSRNQRQPHHSHSRPRLRRRLSEAGDSVRSDNENDGSISSACSSMDGGKASTAFTSAPVSPIYNAAHLAMQKLGNPAFEVSVLNSPPRQSRSGETSSIPFARTDGLVHKMPFKSTNSVTTTYSKRNLNKKQLSLNVPAPVASIDQSRSCPSSPALVQETTSQSALVRSSTQIAEDSVNQAMSMSSTLRGKLTMRRRTSLPKLNMGLAAFPSLSTPIQTSSTSSLPYSATTSSNSNILLSRGTETLNDAMVAKGRTDQFPYEQGPVEILPGLYLGSEQNAKDPETLRRLGISAVLNVAKEVECPWLKGSANEEPILEEEEEEELESASSDGSPPPPARRHVRLPGLKEQSNTSLLIRPASSTPNLQAIFSSNSSPIASTSKARQGFSKSHHLPPQAGEINRRFAPNARNGCPPLEYIKLPWNHDQSDLTTQFPGIFAFLDRTRANGGRVLVHCQCGVSRSASAIIGYVMSCSRLPQQAAVPASLGMHDAYAFVKDKSSWISPNIGLVYQLVEWEKKLRGDFSTPADEAEEMDMLPREERDKSPNSSGTDSFSDSLSTPSDSFCTPLVAVVDGMLSPMAEALAIDADPSTLRAKQDAQLTARDPSLTSPFSPASQPCL